MFITSEGYKLKVAEGKDTQGSLGKPKGSLFPCGVTDCHIFPTTASQTHRGWPPRDAHLDCSSQGFYEDS